ncbi:MAG: formylglycine-generating enzyme family protein [Wenzhouxiangella sp.]
MTDGERPASYSCRIHQSSSCCGLKGVLLIAALLILSSAGHAAGFFGNEVVGATITASNGQEVAIVVPRAYSSSTNQRRLFGGSHPGSLSRESLRQQRYEQALRRLIYQPDLPRDTFATGAAASLRALGLSQQVAEGAKTAFLVVPELVDEDYVFDALGGGELAANLRPLVGQIASDDTHLAHLVAAAPAVLQGASLVNDFVLYKAMATDMAEWRLARLSDLLEQTEAVRDPALVAALTTVRRELDAMRDGRFWAGTLETLRRNQWDLIGSAGKTITGAGLKAVGTANPGMLAFSGTMWGIDRLGDHIESVQLSILIATLAWHAESVTGISGDPEAQALLAYAKAAFSDSLLNAINNPLARLRDVLTPRSNESQMRRHYGELRGHYLEAVDFWLGRWEEPRVVVDDAISDDGHDQVQVDGSCLESNISIDGWSADRVRERQNCAAAALGLEPIFRDCPDCPEMLVIPAGRFMMGSLENEPQRWDREGPRREVNVPAFAIAVSPVTVGEFRRFVNDTGYVSDAERDVDRIPGCHTFEAGSFGPRSGRYWRNPSIPQDDSHPATCLSWNDAQAFVTWLSAKTGEEYRLPSEAEWEYAARAGTTTRFNTGDCITTDEANFRGTRPAKGCPLGEHRGGTTPVKNFESNAWGLYDTHGNVWEWVQDCWSDDYRGLPTDGSAWVSGNCQFVIRRGGSWYYYGQFLRSAFRLSGTRSDRINSIGFRVARTLQTRGSNPISDVTPSPHILAGSCDADLERIRNDESVTILQNDKERVLEFFEWQGSAYGSREMVMLEPVSKQLPGAERYLLIKRVAAGNSDGSLSFVLRCSNGVLKQEAFHRDGAWIGESCLKVSGEVRMRNDANCCPSLWVTNCLYSVEDGIGWGDPFPRLTASEEAFQRHFGNAALPKPHRFALAGEYAPAYDYGPTHSRDDRYRLYPDGSFAAWEVGRSPRVEWSFGVWSLVRNQVNGQNELIMRWASDVRDASQGMRQYRFPLWLTADGADLVRQARHHRYPFVRLGEVPDQDTALSSCYALPCHIN